MNDELALRAGADAQYDLLDRQVNMFLFDLRNEALELGFGASDTWQLELATDNDVIELKRHHTPVILLKLPPEELLNVYQKVKLSLERSLTGADNELTINAIARSEKSHLAAYPLRIKR